MKMIGKIYYKMPFSKATKRCKFAAEKSLQLDLFI